ncbi:MAG: nitroreductase family protein [Desulfamplus sp.]|nr:nitroreductase family protein [Desulfamplus sp.]
MNENYDVSVVIDTNKCVGCGLCIKVCPSDTISLKNGKAYVTGTSSLSCGHCMAICPELAITVNSLDRNAIAFNTFELEKKWLSYGEPDIKELARLIASRRSCRTFKSRAVERPLIEDLVRFGKLAPSGSNSQKWTFTCLVSREKVVEFAILIGAFYKNLNMMANSRILRYGLKAVGKPELYNYHRDYHDKVNNAIHEMKNNGKDLLFHGATACIIIGSEPGASCPADDALLATQNILLAAHAMGIGTCLIGFAVKAFERDVSIQRKLGIPEEETVYSVIALGYPDEKYNRITGRKAVIERYF